MAGSDPDEHLAALDDAAAARWVPHIFNDRDFRACIEACDRLLTVKGHDYTQGAPGDEGRLKNFYTSAEALGLTPLQVLGVYMKKHLDAVFTFLGKGRVESEPIEGRIHDSINYLILLSKMVAHEKRKAADAAVAPTLRKLAAESGVALPPSMSGSGR